MHIGTVLHRLQYPLSGCIGQNKLNIRALPDKINQNIVIDAAVHASRKKRPGVRHAVHRADRRLRNGGNGVIVIIHPVHTAAVFQPMRETSELRQCLAHLLLPTAENAPRNFHHKLRIQLVVCARNPKLIMHILRK